MEVCLGFSKASSRFKQLARHMRSCTHSSLPSKLQHTCKYTQWMQCAPLTYYPPLLHTQSSVELPSCNPHRRVSSVSQQTASLWRWPQFLPGLCICKICKYSKCMFLLQKGKSLSMNRSFFFLCLAGVRRPKMHLKYSILLNKVMFGFELRNLEGRFKILNFQNL